MQKCNGEVESGIKNTKDPRNFQEFEDSDTIINDKISELKQIVNEWPWMSVLIVQMIVMIWLHEFY